MEPYLIYPDSDIGTPGFVSTAGEFGPWYTEIDDPAGTPDDDTTYLEAGAGPAGGVFGVTPDFASPIARVTAVVRAKSVGASDYFTVFFGTAAAAVYRNCTPTAEWATFELEFTDIKSFLGAGRTLNDCDRIMIQGAEYVRISQAYVRVESVVGGNRMRLPFTPFRQRGRA